MAQPNLKDDLQFVKNEILLGMNFLTKYFGGKATDRKKKYTAKILEFGPINGLKLLLVIFISGFFLITFSLYRSEGSMWLLLIIFIICYEIIFAKEWITPFLKEIGSIFKAIPIALYEIVKDIVLGITGMKKE